SAAARHLCQSHGADFQSGPAAAPPSLPQTDLCCIPALRSDSRLSQLALMSDQTSRRRFHRQRGSCAHQANQTTLLPVRSATPASPETAASDPRLVPAATLPPASRTATPDARTLPALPRVLGSTTPQTLVYHRRPCAAPTGSRRTRSAARPPRGSVRQCRCRLGS